MGVTSKIGIGPATLNIMKQESLKVGDYPLPLLRYDGAMGEWLQFTEYDPTSPSCGATFYIKDIANLESARQSKRDQFSEALSKI